MEAVKGELQADLLVLETKQEEKREEEEPDASEVTRDNSFLVLTTMRVNKVCSAAELQPHRPKPLPPECYSQLWPPAAAPSQSKFLYWHDGG